MENNNANQPVGQTNSVPTVSEIMSEVAQITSNPTNDVPSVDSIPMPSVTDIPVPAQAAPVQTAPVQTAPVQTAPVQTMPVQTTPVQTMPVQTAPVQTMPVQTTPGYLPQTTYTAAAQQPAKRSVGRIIALIFGILIALCGAFLTFCIAVVDIDAYINEGSAEIVIPAYVVTLIILAIGIVLIVIGAKKDRPAVAYPSASGVNFTTVNTDTPSQSSVPVGVPTAAAQGQPTQMNYQYASTGMIQDDTEKVMKKRARNYGLGAIGVVVLFWILVFALDTAYFWPLIFPFVLAFGGLKTSGGKSVSSWIGMIMAILSAVLFVLLIALSHVG